MLTLAQIFGANAYQDGQVLNIDKSDLPLLIALPSNSSGALLVAIALKALSNFSGTIDDSDGQPILDNNGQPITFDNSNAFPELKIFRWRDAPIQRDGKLFIRKTLVVEIYEEYA